MEGDTRSNRWRSRAAEATIVAMACLAPWAFGSVEAWAALALDLGIAAVAILALWAGGRPQWRRQLLCPPSLAIAGLCVLALLQAAPLPEGLLRRVVPESMALRTRVLPKSPERVAGDTQKPVPLPSAVISREPEASLDMAARLAAAWILFQAVLGLGGGRPALRSFGVAITVNATLLALFSLVQSLTWDGKIYWFRESPQTYGWFAGGPFVSHNHLAAYLNLGLGFALAFLMPGSAATNDPAARRKGARLWAGYAVGVLITGILASHSRSGFLGMLAALGCIGFVFCLKSRGKALKIAGAAVAIVGLVIAFMVAAGNTSALSRLGTILDASAYSDRLEIWRTAIRAWATSPLAGMGLGSFQVAMAPFFRRDHGVMFGRAENEYIDVLVEGGIVGLGLLLLLLVSVFRLAARAIGAAKVPQDRTLLLGALFGMVALATQSLGDFGLHIPGVAVPAVIIVAYLCSAGLEAGAPGVEASAEPAEVAEPRRVPWPLLITRLGTVAVSLVIVVHGFRFAAAEALLAHSDIPMPGSAPRPGSRPAQADLGANPLAGLERRRDKLIKALRFRPDWAEGHLRLGMTYLDLYTIVAGDWIGETEQDPDRIAAMSDPLWLHAVVHSPEAAGSDASRTLLEHEPVSQYLAPAARSFLQARRCAPALALPEARLAGLDFLLEGGDSSAAYAERAFALAGAQVHVLELTGEVAVQIDDLDLAAKCWKRWLLVDDSQWEKVADSASEVLPPETILNSVIPANAQLTLLFADRLYAEPEDENTRKQYFEKAIARLPAADGHDAERLYLEAILRERLGDRDRARQQMEAALALDPLRVDWRKTLVNWLLAWGEAEEARKQAILGLRLGPPDPALQKAMETAAETLARGERAKDPATEAMLGRDIMIPSSILHNPRSHSR